MRRLPSSVAALVAVPLVAASSFAAAFPETIPLATGWQPEGIAAGRGLTAYVGSLADGGITRVDLRTGERDDEFVPSAPGPAVGLEYEAGADRLWVAGGPSGEIRVYAAASGAILETYTFTAGFINDLVVTGDGVYATDSVLGFQQLLVVPLAPDGRLPDPEEAFALPITGELVYEAGFNANGIEAFGGWLLVGQSNTGELFAVDPATGDSIRLLPDDSINAADGLLLVGNKLYVVQNQLNTVSIWKIRGGSVTMVGSLGGADSDLELDVPTTVAFAGGALWAANARFGVADPTVEPFWITRIPLH
jgi:hypothetical protein